MEATATAATEAISGGPDAKRFQRESVGVRFGQNLRRHRLQEGLSQEQLGVRAGVHRTEIGLLEKGGRVPGIDVAIRLADAMAIPLEALTAGIHWTVPGPVEGSYTFTPRGREL